MKLELNGSPDSTRIYWASAAGALGYDVIAGDIAAIAVQDGHLSLGLVRVLARGTSESSVVEASDGPMPAPGSGFFYLIQQRSAHAGAGHGTESAPLPREPLTCDGGCP